MNLIIAIENTSNPSDILRTSRHSLDTVMARRRRVYMMTWQEMIHGLGLKAYK